MSRGDLAAAAAGVAFLAVAGAVALDQERRTLAVSPAGPPDAPAPASAGIAGPVPPGMEYAFTGDPDRDFASLLLRHGTIAARVARAQAEHGRDPDMRRLAQGIAAARERDAERLHAFLATRGLGGVR